MDSIAEHLGPISPRVAVPRSVPGLVTPRVMAMTYIQGTPLMQLKDKVAHLPKWKREKVGHPLPAARQDSSRATGMAGPGTRSAAAAHAGGPAI